MTFDVTVELALGADLTDVVAAWSWTDITAYVFVRDAIAIARGRGDEFSTVGPSKLALTLDNSDGRFCVRNPLGAYYGTLNRNTPIRVRLDPGSGPVTRILGFVDQWPPRWDLSMRHRYVPVTASGVLRRLQQGGSLRSALYRAHAVQLYSSQSSPKAYWPCEDESGSLTIASGIGGTPMSYVSVDLGSDSEIAGSDPLMVLGAGANFAGTVPPYTATGQNAIRCVMRIPSAPGATVYPFGWYCSGTLNPWRLAIVPGSPDVLRVEAFNAAGTEMLSDPGIDLEATDGGLYGRQIYVEVDWTQSGADISWETGVWYNATNGTGQSGTEASVTAGTVTGVALTGPAGATGVTVGHIAVADDTAYGVGSYGSTGFAGETTNSRFVRLTAEADIAWGGVSTRNTYMGAQAKTELIDLFRECEAAESGVLYEARTENGLILLPREDRENRAVDLVLDFDQGHIVEPFAPTEDDFGLFNDVEVTVEGGSSGRAVDLAHVAKNGAYPGQVPLNLDPNIEDPSVHASWWLHLGTTEDQRYPQIAFKLHGSPELVDDWLGCDIGSRVTVANPPPGGAPDPIDVHIEGYAERITPTTWDVVLNTSPALPWQIATVATGLQADTSSQLLVDYDSTATSFLIAHPDLPRGLLAPPLWSTTAEPYDWSIGGEKVTATSVTTNLTTFVGAGTAATGNNASVVPTIHGSSAKGDLMLLWAAIRVTSGTVGTPSGWQRLQDFGNTAMFGKVHDGTESSPTVAFTGGAAGDDTIAQIATFRNAQMSVVVSATQSNGSAQDIATPALPGVDRNNLLIIYLGWKQDDATSVVSPGTEIGETSATAGNDALLVWSYTIQTGVTEIPATQFTVTGGASAVSKGAVIALKGDVQTATVTRSVNGVVKAQTAGTTVSLWHPTSLAL